MVSLRSMPRSRPSCPCRDAPADEEADPARRLINVSGAGAQEAVDLFHAIGAEGDLESGIAELVSRLTGGVPVESVDVELRRENE